MLLSAPLSVQGFELKLRQIDHWLQELLAQDTDAALYLMFQRASFSTVGYSASHAMVCACLCHVLAQELGLGLREHQVLALGALTMNIGMSALQDELALQREPLSPAQRLAVQRHPQVSKALLMRLFITDPMLLELVAEHHQPQPQDALEKLPPARQLAHILSTVDRYAALISPRRSRPGRSATDSLNRLAQHTRQLDQTGQALVRAVGLYPPGTYVRLNNGDIGVVLRRGSLDMPPQVASVMDAAGHGLVPPHIHETGLQSPRIRESLAQAAIARALDPRTLAQLGVHAARASQALWRMVEI